MQLIVTISEHHDGDCSNHDRDVSQTSRSAYVFSLHKHCVAMASVCALVSFDYKSCHLNGVCRSPSNRHNHDVIDVFIWIQ